jgi:hypothetical protein
MMDPYLARDARGADLAAVGRVALPEHLECIGSNRW